ncbi:hypothetical protein B0H67DRAFT_130871 [Lasiosphaeris hirsuta]|uniref:Uncharacterized protein n=1 Tax=Lasiosphaeris hirsuta TaxID=260670 RepID=A0AA40B0G7_9PEZI|nr:hypothetical protein B0H67DRAFT_130871 [Lasiosphaeris hirsuta]
MGLGRFKVGSLFFAGTCLPHLSPAGGGTVAATAILTGKHEIRDPHPCALLLVPCKPLGNPRESFSCCENGKGDASPKVVSWLGASLGSVRQEIQWKAKWVSLNFS